MNTIGIITEYNPFHNGHKYQIETLRAMTGAQNIIIIMSGDFVQRGTPAWTDKYLRTQMALLNGADMVFELPVAFSTSSAMTFAHAGVSILTLLDFVDGICFGSEYDNLPLLEKTADFLSAPPASFEERIRCLTADGISYPAARQKALNELFFKTSNEASVLPDSPNTILALEYLTAIRRLNSPLKAFLIQRNDKGYHSDSIDTCFASASAIRNVTTDFLDTISSAVPGKVLRLLKTNSDRYPITENDFSDLLYYRLLHLKKEDNTILDMTGEILYRIQKMLPEFTTFSEFTTKIKTKQYTYSRISRVLLHCLLEISYSPYASLIPDFCKTGINSTSIPATELPFVPYARLLGFRKEKSRLLRNKTKLPVITKPADGMKQIMEFYGKTKQEPSKNAVLQTIPKSYTDYAAALYRTDLAASNLYRQVQSTTLGCKRKNEYLNQPVIL